MSASQALSVGDAQAIKSNFDTNGFAVIDELSSPETTATLRKAYDALLAGHEKAGVLDRQLGGITRQIMLPHTLHEAFADNEAIENGRKVASALLGQDATDILFSMLIYKPAGHPHTTPWHQDASYAGQPVSPAGTLFPNNSVVQFWVALDDVTQDMGCMEFVPGVHQKPMPEHYVASGDPEDDGRLLAMVDAEQVLDLDTAVACPLKAGQATVHGYLTPHYTGPNKSADRGRPAFIFSFANPEALASLMS